MQPDGVFEGKRMKKGQFKIQKSMDVGTNNPIVDSLTIGLFDIVNMAQISEKEKESINAINLKIVRHLTKAQQISDKICSAIDRELNKLNKEGIKTQSRERCVNVPHTEYLDDVRDFLKYGKKSLQEMVAIFNLFLETNVSGPKYHILLDKVKHKYGQKDPLYITLKKDHDSWLKHFIDLRNDEEHPEDRLPEGKEFYYDFDINWSAKDKEWVISQPHFYEGTSIYKFAKISIHNILTFVEEINILFLQKKMPSKIQIREVPEKQRKKYNGRRFVLDWKRPSTKK
jgi:hypothetical protein